MQKFRVHCRHYSRPLQRALTDFGADVSFEQAAVKMKEHYGLTMAPSAVQKITKNHARQIGNLKTPAINKTARLMVAEMDGGMVPIVEVDEVGSDLRKTRKVGWREAKLCFARVHNQISRVYAAIIGTPEEAGAKLYECAKNAGFTETTYVHAIGDGAQWIVDQIENQFGSQGHFLIDFFHMCEYLAGASPWCDALDAQGWLKKKKEMMKSGKCAQVLRELKKRLSEIESVSEDNGLLKCIRYMEKRLKYMHYDQAMKKDLPIGSGEIESSHRHVVQKRLKIAGAWWKSETANAMLELRTARINGHWQRYWDEQKVA
jgi:hypothetical protein